MYSEHYQILVLAVVLSWGHFSPKIISLMVKVAKPIGVQWVGTSPLTKRISNILIPEFNLTKQISWTFHANDPSQSSNTYDMVI
jgi:hypothetical protein